MGNRQQIDERHAFGVWLETRESPRLEHMSTKPAAPLSVSDLIDILGGNAATARICGFKKNHSARGGDLRRRKYIPVNYWPNILQHARANKLSGVVTPVTLIEAHVGHRLPN